MCPRRKITQQVIGVINIHVHHLIGALSTAQKFTGFLAIALKTLRCL